uniref:Trypsin Inhibitor like cysteine rich domain protein n=1 Tax=Syphacia muris TaxID=451379 RepID=A0A0N5AM43_9BILA
MQSVVLVGLAAGILMFIYPVDMKKINKNVYACENETDCEVVQRCKKECKIEKKNLVLMNCFHFCRLNGTDKEQRLFQRFRNRVRQMNDNANSTVTPQVNKTRQDSDLKSKRSAIDDSCENSDGDFMQMSLENEDFIQLYSSEGISSESSLGEINDGNFTASTPSTTTDTGSFLNETTRSFDNPEFDDIVTASEISVTKIRSVDSNGTFENITELTNANNETEFTSKEETTTIALEKAENDTAIKQGSSAVTENLDKNSVVSSSGVLPVGELKKQKGGSKCPRPTPCAPKCAVAVDSNGCQVCRCLWISKECTTDDDCDKDSQICDLGRCECAENFVQNMEQSGVCIKLAESLGKRVLSPVLLLQILMKTAGENDTDVTNMTVAASTTLTTSTVTETKE